MDRLLNADGLCSTLGDDLYQVRNEVFHVGTGPIAELLNGEIHVVMDEIRNICVTVKNLFDLVVLTHQRAQI